MAIACWALIATGWLAQADEQPRVDTPAPIATASLTGRVMWHDGEPIAGAAVLYMTYRDSMWDHAVVTDADGRFLLEGIDAKHEREILIQPPGAFPLRESLPFDEARVYEHEFVVDGERVLSGRVLEADTSAPIADAAIVPCVNGSAPYSAMTTSRADGSFEIKGAPDGWKGLGIAARKDGWCGSVREFEDRDHDDEFGMDSTASWVFWLSRECVLEGTVTRSDGSLVAGAQIIVFQFGGTGSSRFDATTGADGAYRIRGLSARARCEEPRLEFAGLTCGGKRPKFARAGDTQRLDWTIPGALGAIEGLVTVNGKPGEATVSWSSGNFGDTMFSLNDDSTYRFTGVPAGEIELFVDFRANGFEPRVERIVVAPDETTRRDIALTIDFAQIRGVVELCRYPSDEALESMLERIELDPSAIDGIFPRLDASGLRVVATRNHDGFVLTTNAAADGSFAFALPTTTPDPWTITVDDARVDASENRKASAKTYAGATTVRVTAWARSDR